MFGNGRTALKAALGLTTCLARRRDLPAQNQGRHDADVERREPQLCSGLRLRKFGAEWRMRTLSDSRSYRFAAATRVAPTTPGKGSTVSSTTGMGGVSAAELRPNVALNVGYFRTWYAGCCHRQQAVTAADYDPCLRHGAAIPPPGGGGNEICGLRRQTDGVRSCAESPTQSSNYDSQTEVDSTASPYSAGAARRPAAGRRRHEASEGP